MPRMTCRATTSLLAICLSLPASGALAQPVEETLTTVLAAENLDSPLLVTAPPGDARLFIVEKTGAIRIVQDGVLLPAPFLNIADKVSTSGERGLLGLAFHPQYGETGYFYIDYTDPSGNTVVERYHVSSDANVADASSASVVLTIEQPFENHNGGNLAFGPLDHYLYIGTGDGGSGGDPFGNAQNRKSRLGKILRIDVDGPAPFGIPPTNPFTGLSDPFDDALDEIWSWGLRNPWRFSFDRANGDLYIADVGQSRREELDIQPGSSGGGENYGWNRMEGTACYSPSTGCDTSNLVLPVLDYVNGANCSITGGFVYRGSAIPDLQGTYFFADWCSGNIWTLRKSNGGFTDYRNRKEELDPPGPLTIGSISSFGEDAAGELYICDLRAGRVWKIVARDPGDVIDSGPEPAGVELCGDGADNDGDGQIDNSDPDCGPNACAFALCGRCIIPATLAVAALLCPFVLRRRQQGVRKRSDVR